MMNALVKNAELTTGHIAVVMLYVNADMWSLMIGQVVIAITLPHV